MSDLKDRPAPTFQQSPAFEEELCWALASIAGAVPAKKRAKIAAAIEKRAAWLDRPPTEDPNVTSLSAARYARAYGISVERARSELEAAREARASACRWLIGSAF